MGLILCVCLLVPHFEPVLSLAGGVPGTLITVFLPLLIYINLFPTSNCDRCQKFYMDIEEIIHPPYAWTPIWTLM